MIGPICYALLLATATVATPLTAERDVEISDAKAASNIIMDLADGLNRKHSTSPRSPKDPYDYRIEF